MLPRHAISDADGDRVTHRRPGQPGQQGGAAEDNRRFLHAVLWIARTGAAGADLPARLGNGNRPWRRSHRPARARAGRWDPLLAALRAPDLDVLILDSTAVRAPPCAAGSKESGTGPAAKASRRSAAAVAAAARRSTVVSTA